MYDIKLCNVLKILIYLYSKYIIILKKKKNSEILNLNVNNEINQNKYMYINILKKNHLLISTLNKLVVYI